MTVSKTTILLLEDDVEAAEALSMLLRTIFSTTSIEVFHRADDALASLDQACPDAIISDLELPGMSGHAFARLVRAHPRCHRTFLIAISGSNPDVITATGDRVFDVSMAKPLDLPALISLLAPVVQPASSETLRS